MDSKNVSVYLYIIAGFLSLLATIIDSEGLMILSKPVIIPSLLTYYFVSTKKDPSLILLAVLVLYFISDAITLIRIEDAVLYIMILDFIPYFLLFITVSKDTSQCAFRLKNLFIASLLFLILMVAMYFLVDSFRLQQPEFVIPVISYGLFLALFVCVSFYNYFATNFSDAASFIFFAALFGLIADVIFVMTTMVFNVKALTYIEFAFQFISYFYIVAYFIDRDTMFVEENLEQKSIASK